MNFFSITILLLLERGEQMDSEALIKKAKQGEKVALVQLIMLEQQEFYKLAYSYMGNSDEAMDAMQDMILILYENIRMLRKEASFYSWSKTILVNCCRKQLRHRSKVIPIEKLEEVETETEAEGVFSQKEDQLFLDNHIAALNAKHQEIIKLRYFLDLDNQTIASLIHIPIGTVKSRISIALKKLKESMGGEKSE
jgi:RNA polymerase sigma factor (sigma-70 family)